MLGLPHARREILHVQPDPPLGAAVRQGGVERPAMVERRLAGAERAENGHLLGNALDRLALEQHVVGVGGESVVAAARAMAAGHHAHAAALGRGRRQGEPHGDLGVAVEAPVGEVLVPADVGG
jgi:hypothetical protein